MFMLGDEVALAADDLPSRTQPMTRLIASHEADPVLNLQEQPLRDDARE